MILHWLGDMFDPALRGYWGSPDIFRATATFEGLVREHADKVDGVKVSLLDAAHEVALRRALPDGVRLYTGDDFNYPELIIGDGQRPFRRAARHLRRDLPRGVDSPAGTRRGQCRRRAGDPGVHPCTRQAHLRGTDVLLQDRHRVPGLAQRPSTRLRDGGRSGQRTLGRPPESRCSSSPTARACSPTRIWPPTGCAPSSP